MARLFQPSANDGARSMTRPNAATAPSRETVPRVPAAKMFEPSKLFDGSAGTGCC